MPNVSVTRPPETRSPAEIVQDVLRDVSDIVRAEIRLARTEMTEQAQKAGQAAGFFAGAAVCGLLAAACLTACIIALIALVTPVWVAALLTCIFLVCIAAAVYHGAQLKLKGFQPVPQRTIETMKETLQWAKERTT